MALHDTTVGAGPGYRTGISPAPLLPAGAVRVRAASRIARPVGQKTPEWPLAFEADFSAARGLNALLSLLAAVRGVG